MTAAGTVAMILAGIVPANYYALAALAGFLLIPVVIEAGEGWAVSSYIAQSILACLLSANLDANLSFIFFFGCYPILKALLEKKLRQGRAVFVKLAFFNAAAVLEFQIAVLFFRISADSYSLFGHSVPWLFLLAGNLIFLTYDYALSLLILSYCHRIRPHLKRWFHLG